MNIIGGDEDEDDGAEGKDEAVQTHLVEDAMSLINRMDLLEKSVAETNVKLDLILQKLGGK